MKQQHEESMTSEGLVDKRAQLNEEQWAYLIDELQRRFFWDDWRTQMSNLLWSGGDGPLLPIAIKDALAAGADWLYCRAWPDGHVPLREALQDLSAVVADLLRIFEHHSEKHPFLANTLSTIRFYKIDRWDPPLYHRLVTDYQEHVHTVMELALLATRYCNLAADYVRRNIDGSFRFETGLLTVRKADGLFWSIHRPEFTTDEINSDARYLGLVS